MGGKVRRVIRAEEVPQIFQMKANGKSNVDIAEAMSVSDSHISTILHRKAFADVDVPQHLLDAVDGMLIHRRPNKKKKVNDVDESVKLSDESDAVTEYTRACYSLVAAERKCVKAGVDRDVLSNLLHVITKQRHL